MKPHPRRLRLATGTQKGAVAVQLRIALLPDACTPLGPLTAPCPPGGGFGSRPMSQTYPRRPKTSSEADLQPGGRRLGQR